MQYPTVFGFITYLFSHFIASLFLATMMARILKIFYKYPYRRALILSFSIFFFLGPFAVLFGVISVLIYTKISKAPAPVKEVDYEILFSVRVFSEKRRLGEGSLRFAKVKDLERVLYFTKFYHPLTVRFFKELLFSDNDELRLLANSYLKNAEKYLQELIYELEKVLESQDLGKDVKFFVCRTLAFLNWDVYYLGFMEGQIAKKYLDNAKEYVIKALEIKEDPSLYLLMGRMEMSSRDYQKAYEHFKRALDLGMEPIKVLPYLLEALYKLRNFKELKQVSEKYRGTYSVNPKRMALISAWV
ncbi:tetratricopeptide repeat protein [Thermocrinis sp.]|jgi:tetratricopeptide (TPR) repeat protein|uniref:tetratricopeptide repeat protein n=1 Tax=Thermocrinis sp. TaxID=2024383 RepID=UPI003C0B9BF9